MFRFGIAVLAATSLLFGQPASRQQPNIVLLYIDNVGWGDLSCYGNPAVRTPNIDRLASEGVRLTDFYIPSSSCSPSRGALLTGRYPARNGLSHQLSVEENWTGIGLPHSERLLPEYLRDGGYATGAFGKWNIGFAVGSRPTDRGFDEYIGCISGNCDYYTHIYNGRNDMRIGTEPATVRGYTTDIFADAAADFIRRNANRPFFAFVPFNAAHYPNPKNKSPEQRFRWQAPAEFFRLYGYDPETSVPEHGYRAVLTALDAGIGRVLEQLDRERITDRTLVVLASDNGAWVGPRKPELEVASNAPFRDGRTSLYEGGVRTPCILRWPGYQPTQSCESRLSTWTSSCSPSERRVWRCLETGMSMDATQCPRFATERRPRTETSTSNTAGRRPCAKADGKSCVRRRTRRRNSMTCLSTSPKLPI